MDNVKTFVQMFYQSLFFGRQPCTQFEVSSSSEFLKVTDILDFFFISHPPLGQKEGKEYQRIMFYYPDSEALDKKTDVTGFAEAVVNFTGDFVEGSDSLPSTSDYDFRYIDSTNTCEVIIAVEDSQFLIGACLNRKSCKANNFVIHQSSIRTQLIKAYESFRLFYGSFKRLLAVAGAIEFQKFLSRFFTPYLTILQISKIPLVELFSGVDFMPLSGVHYLEVECLVSRCVEEFPSVAYTLFLYRDKLIQFSVEKADLIPLHQFLTQSLIPFSLQAALQPEVAQKSTANEKYTGYFITGMQDFLGTLAPTGFPIVHLHTDDNSAAGGCLQSYELIAYHVLNATICLLVPLSASAGAVSDHDAMLAALADFLDERIRVLASHIGEVVGGQQKAVATAGETPFHFIYYNPDSLSVRSSFYSSISFAQVPGTAGPLPHVIYKLIYETYDHFVTDPKQFSQVYVKAENDWWLVFKKINRRVLLLFIPLTAQSTIADVHMCTDAIVRSHFSHIYVP